VPPDPAVTAGNGIRPARTQEKETSMLDLKIIIGSTLRQARSRGTLPPAIVRPMAAQEGARK
jgi:hypothetical protein